MPPRHKNHSRCSRCGHCRTWRVNKAFRRTTKTYGVEKRHFKVCNRCSRLYRKTGPLTEDEFRKKYDGSDHTDSDPDDDDDAEGEDDGPDAEPKRDDNHDQGGSSGQGGVGQAITAA